MTGSDVSSLALKGHPDGHAVAEGQAQASVAVDPVLPPDSFPEQPGGNSTWTISALARTFSASIPTAMHARGHLDNMILSRHASETKASRASSAAEGEAARASSIARSQLTASLKEFSASINQRLPPLSHDKDGFVIVASRKSWKKDSPTTLSVYPHQATF